MEFIARHSVEQGINLRTSISISTHTHTYTLASQVSAHPSSSASTNCFYICDCECLLFWSKFIFNILVARLHAKLAAAATASAEFENTIN